MNSHIVPVVIEQDADGFFINCPVLQGCFSQGETYEEAIANIRDAIGLHLQDRLECGEEINFSKNVSVMALQVAA